MGNHYSLWLTSRTRGKDNIGKLPLIYDFDVCILHHCACFLARQNLTKIAQTSFFFHIRKYPLDLCL